MWSIITLTCLQSLKSTLRATSTTGWATCASPTTIAHCVPSLIASFILRYFEIVKLPRYTGSQREYEVELQYTSGLLGMP